MKNSDVFFFTAPTEEIVINSNELALRLGTERGYNDELIEKCRKKLTDLLEYKCSYVRMPVDLSEENICRFDFMTAESRYLYRNLSGCSEVFLLAVTCGIAVDRELARLRVISQAEYFVTDALASAAADSFCAYAAKKIKGSCICAPRFSPGYGDLKLELQPYVLERLNAGELLGITLSSSFLMTPMKSITAIMGIRK